MDAAAPNAGLRAHTVAARHVRHEIGGTAGPMPGFGLDESRRDLGRGELATGPGELLEVIAGY